MVRSQSQMSRDDEDDDLYSYFNKSVSAVQAHADQFEKAFARPALETSQEFYDRRPIAATFIVIFTLLSFFPVISFIGFSLFAVVSFTIIALSCAFLASLTVMLTLFSLLVLALLTALVSSAVLTLLSISVYSFIRLFNLMQAHGRAGIPVWFAEMKEAIINIIPIQFYSPKREPAELSDGEDVVCDLEVEVKLEESDALYSGSTQGSCDEDVKA